MKIQIQVLIIFILSTSACTSSKNLTYLNNVPETGGDEVFLTDIPLYKIQTRDILYLTIKALTPEGKITDFLITTGAYMSGANMQGDAGSYLYGYDVNSEGNLVVPSLGAIKVAGLTLEEAKKLIQLEADKVFRNSTVECKLLSFKFTVIGEVKAPGAYVNYNNYLTVFEAIGRAGGVSDYGNRSSVLIVRPSTKGNSTININLQDKSILASEAYFIQPNDVVIVQPMKNKIFNMNTPTVSFFITTVTSVITTTLLLINYFK
jgi:polysaccharide export outer membrane protein